MANLIKGGARPADEFLREDDGDDDLFGFSDEPEARPAAPGRNTRGRRLAKGESPHGPLPPPSKGGD